ncbi:hypothetical protein BOW52_05965 [Solemya elarraichensis gill symbiont]|uniref:Uncharacterized protein n=1 Tax=Solemya elarraichensis gill symbiont TaxID=1918949 RepID=A0A1T2L5N3_9GAMM|nr:hypothetical protein BOW52_05965 [Solemya elarraichensis gill symbiont]
MLQRLQQTLESGQPDTVLVTALIRGISGTISKTVLASMFEQVMQQAAGSSTAYRCADSNRRSRLESTG